ncbi:ArsR/SmtB family transcription factor [Pelagibacterium halotolerans]|uniref:Transcriptional regulator, ArsR family n=1 Tax=Pelagibacterium halotolerans (strain DSM 22347 / JCM 15775 / CGMCC 1.7692 / B2) TaxID=1082931 RepID=G4REZ3_PELHB|nr:helix-turn-helix domain-containing protein [Pelagibacterium halotolerans]AEQ52926.1 transcriptional regulator, ArsR family [Pelagibacterium halotolerans B2]QJR17404.1 helix-turn-helix transcriptional regulator [Pelagibacterium halotolerans]SEA73352.1 transcriptional regulator, ArsR family [Pelagibacterium halotolerans]
MREISKIVPGPKALKALTHPDRLKMLGILRMEGPQTATTLAERLGLNSGATSYHLRQLAGHGFIEADETRGNRRDRWWKAKHESTMIELSEARGEALDASMAMMQSVISHHAAAMQRAHEGFNDLPQEWKKAQTFSDYTIAMSAEAAQGLMEDIHALLMKHKGEAPAPGEELAEGWRPFTVHLHGFPYQPLGKGEDE